ncbi:MAG: TnpA family transposase [Saprospiraceae bacterium]|jgi:TnpA family transposase
MIFVVPGTNRDSLYLLAGVLEQPTDLKPTEIMVDTAGYSDIVFELFLYAWVSIQSKNSRYGVNSFLAYG